MRAFPAVTERIVAYDETNRTLTYQATGLPALLGAARNTWRVSSIGQRQARAGFDGVLETRGAAGLLIALPLRLRMRRETRTVLDDLKHYAEHGTPSESKQRRPAGASGLLTQRVRLRKSAGTPLACPGRSAFGKGFETSAP
jgi:hypothetical protein